MAVGALLAATAAWGMGALLDRSRPQARFLPVLVASEVGAIPATVVVYLLYRFGPVFLSPNIILVFVGVVIVALAATATNWALRGPGSGWLGRAVVPVGLLVLVGAGAGGAYILNGALRCTTDERTVLAEFPQYGGFESEAESRDGGCVVGRETRDTPEAVYSHYSENLRARGWTLDVPTHTGPPRPPAEDGTLVAATRDGFRYQVHFSPAYPSPRADNAYVGVSVLEQGLLTPG